MNLSPVLVTGASGFLGGALVERLAATGGELHLVARGALAAPAGARAHRVDLEDAGAVAALVAAVRPRTVFHLASRVTGSRELDQVLPTLGANLAAAVHLMTACAVTGIERLVLAGSMEEPAAGEAPSSPYAAAKASASLYAAMFHALYRLPVVTARIFMVYGPGQRDSSKLVPATIAAALAGERPRISSGTRAVDWIHVDDVVDGLLAMAAATGVEGRTIDLGTGVLTTVREVAERICRLCGAPPPAIGALDDRPLETVRRADPEATHRALGWRPRLGLDEGLARTVAAAKERREPAR